MSIIPGMEMRAPERMERRRGFLGSPNLHPHGLFQLAHGRLYLLFQAGRIFFLVGVVDVADFGGDGESGGNGNLQAGHFRQIAALATQKVAHLGVPYPLFLLQKNTRTFLPSSSLLLSILFLTNQSVRESGKFEPGNDDLRRDFGCEVDDNPTVIFPPAHLSSFSNFR